MQRNAGVSLVELAIGLSVLLVGILAFFTNFYVNIRASAMVAQRDQARAVFDDVSETLRSAVLDEVYTRFHKTTVEAPGELLGPDGGPAVVEIFCHTNETALPPEFGPLVDLDGDGALQTLDCSTDYELLPVELSVSYMEGNDMITLRSYLILGSDE